MAADAEPVSVPRTLTRREAFQMAAGAAAVATVARTSPADAAARRSPGAFDPVAAAADRLIADGVAPGLSVAVMKAGQLAFVRGFGQANLETSTPVTPESVFHVGSVTKQFTATALALLAEDGKLSLDDRLSRFLPLFPRAGDVTLRQMVTHTSGLGNYTDTEPRDAFYRAARLDYDDPHLLAAMAATAPLFKTEPGTAWAYSNTAYVLLGLVVQIAAGQKYGDFLKRRLFDPAGLTQTAVDDLAEVVPHRANGYSKGEGGGKFRNAAFISMTFPHAAGALRSTPSDLCRWHAALLGGRIVRPATLKEMLTPVRLPNGELPPAPPNPMAKPDSPKTVKYGFGLMFGDFEGHEYTEHDGGIFGFLSLFRSFWPQQVTVAVLMNSDAIQSPADYERLTDVRDAAARAALATG
jgi:CubicO group peptidase (beta-lactamase class C family)